MLMSLMYSTPLLLVLEGKQPGSAWLLCRPWHFPLMSDPLSDIVLGVEMFNSFILTKTSYCRFFYYCLYSTDKKAQMGQTILPIVTRLLSSQLSRETNPSSLAPKLLMMMLCHIRENGWFCFPPGQRSNRKLGSEARDEILKILSSQDC